MCQREVVSLRQEFIVSVIFQLFIKATNSYLLYGDSPYLVDILKEMSSEYYILGVPVIHCQRNSLYYKFYLSAQKFCLFLSLLGLGCKEIFTANQLINGKMNSFELNLAYSTFCCQYI